MARPDVAGSGGAANREHQSNPRGINDWTWVVPLRWEAAALALRPLVFYPIQHKRNLNVFPTRHLRICDVGRNESWFRSNHPVGAQCSRFGMCTIPPSLTILQNPCSLWCTSPPRSPERKNRQYKLQCSRCRYLIGLPLSPARARTILPKGF